MKERPLDLWQQYRQDLFNAMATTPTSSEMDEVERIVLKWARRTADKSAFKVWWKREGRNMEPLPGDSADAYIRRVCEIAWANGAYTRNSQNKP